MIKRQLIKGLEGLHKNKYKTLNTVNISRNKLINNVSVYQKLDPNKKIIAVLKANAYGHGLKHVAEILNDTDIKFIAVDGYFEANRILDISRHKILVMGYVLPENFKLIDGSRCSFVIQDKESLKALGKLKRNFNIHMEINTGMNRLGIKPQEIDDFLEELAGHKNLTLEGVMTHLADADNKNNSYTEKQTKLFDKSVDLIRAKGYSPKFFHIAQSAGSTKCESKYANAIRIGIGLYGVNPLNPKDPNYYKLTKLKPIMELTSTIVKVNELASGERISYNGIYQTKEEARIGVLPLGYYEWVPRQLSNIGYFTSSNKLLAIRGRVCMNHTMVDLSGTKLKVGDKVTVISSDHSKPNSIQSIADNYGLFTYTLMTRMAESVRREIV